MSSDTSSKTDRIEAKIDLLIEMSRGLDVSLRAVEMGLSRLEGNVDGRLSEMSSRITDIYTRLPVPLAYQPPGPGRKRA